MVFKCLEEFYVDLLLFDFFFLLPWSNQSAILSSQLKTILVRGTNFILKYLRDTCVEIQKRTRTYTIYRTRVYNI